jgi:hypothetical protein
MCLSHPASTQLCCQPIHRPSTFVLSGVKPAPSGARMWGRYVLPEARLGHYHEVAVGTEVILPTLHHLLVLRAISEKGSDSRGATYQLHVPLRIMPPDVRQTSMVRCRVGIWKSSGPAAGPRAGRLPPSPLQKRLPVSLPIAVPAARVSTYACAGQSRVHSGAAHVLASRGMGRGLFRTVQGDSYHALNPILRAG